MEQNNNYIIYCHKNKLNNKRYIGQTKMSVSRRWGKNGSEYLRKGNDHFKKAIKKYGWDNFEHLILFTNLSQEEANQKEIELIEYYNANNPDYGYNLAKGGNNYDENAREKWKNNKSKINYQLWEDGTFKKIICKEVYCIELDLTFESALEAQRKTGIDNSSIAKVCKHEFNYAGFLPNGQPIHWIYLKDKTENIIQQLKNKPEIIKGSSIPLLCIETNEIFNSSTEAGKAYGVAPNTIRKCAIGLCKQAGKNKITGQPLHWKALPELMKNKNKLTQEKMEELLK